MEDFKKTIDRTEFTFKYIQEGKDVVFLVNADNHSFRMVTDEQGIWGIWQQVPGWIKNIEEELSAAIEENYSAVGE
jgi:hypothetical protein